MMTFGKLEVAAKGSDGILAVPGAADPGVIEAAVKSGRRYGTSALLFGQGDEIGRLLNDAGYCTNHDNIEIIEASCDEEAAHLAAQAIISGKADLLMKGNLPTGTFMRGLLHTDGLVPEGALLSHVMLHEVPSYPKLLTLTDGGLIPFPDLAKKKGILQNAVQTLRRLGYGRITAAALSAVETVNEKIPSSVDAAALAADPVWPKQNVTVFGPCGLDLAISRNAAKVKRYEAEGVGDADIILVPSFEVGNGISKALTYFAGSASAGVVVGAACPVVLVSRADTAGTKLSSIAFALALINKQTEELYD
jgi:phosphate butyryltransferase